MIGRIRKLFRPLESLLFPSYCYTCETDDTGEKLTCGVCDDCWGRLAIIGGSICYRCGLPMVSDEPRKATQRYLCDRCRRAKRFPFSVMRSLYRYQSPLREIIHLFKFEGMASIGELLAARLARWTASSSDFAVAEVVVPVPLHRWRRIERGFNQAEMLAHRVAEAMELPAVGNDLVRTINTRPQSSLQKEQRLKNVKGAFEASGDHVAGKRVLLVDDVVSTETTVRECARALKRSGASEVMILTLARAVDL